MTNIPSAATAVGSNNHIALNVPPDKIDEYREKLLAEGVHVSDVKYWTIDRKSAPNHAPNTFDVLSDVGYSADQIMQLRIDGAIT